jgi:hypothetical protein
MPAPLHQLPIDAADLAQLVARKMSSSDRKSNAESLGRIRSDPALSFLQPRLALRLISALPRPYLHPCDSLASTSINVRSKRFCLLSAASFEPTFPARRS